MHCGRGEGRGRGGEKWGKKRANEIESKRREALSLFPKTPQGTGEKREGEKAAHGWRSGKQQGAKKAAWLIPSKGLRLCIKAKQRREGEVGEDLKRHQ